MQFSIDNEYDNISSPELPDELTYDSPLTLMQKKASKPASSQASQRASHGSFLSGSLSGSLPSSLSGSQSSARPTSGSVLGTFDSSVLDLESISNLASELASGYAADAAQSPAVYSLEPDTAPDTTASAAADICLAMARNVKQRRLEKGLSREALAKMSNVPTPTLAKFEQKGSISLMQFVAVASALGYSDDVRELMDRPTYDSVEELEMIEKNKERKRGRRK